MMYHKQYEDFTEDEKDLVRKAADSFVEDGFVMYEFKKNWKGLLWCFSIPARFVIQMVSPLNLIFLFMNTVDCLRQFTANSATGFLYTLMT